MSKPALRIFAAAACVGVPVVVCRSVFLARARRRAAGLARAAAYARSLGVYPSRVGA